MNEPDENETEVRKSLLKLGARPAGHAPVDGAEPQSAPVAVVIPPRPEYEPTVPGPRRGRASRLPDWWADEKPALTGGDDEQPDAVGDDQAADAVDDDQAADVGEEHADADPDDEISKRTDRPRPLRKVSKEPAADQGEESGEDADEIRRAGEGRGRRLRRAMQGGHGGRPRFSTPVFPRHETEKKSLVQAWSEIPPHTKWGFHHLTGLAGGLLFGVVGFATAVTRSVAESPLPLRENPDAYFWGAGAVLVLAADRATRKWVWLVAWGVRAVTTSLIVGAVLHGNSVGEAIANMPTILDRLFEQP